MCRARDTATVNAAETLVCHARSMFEIADRLLAAADRGRPLAVATAIAIDGSAPRTVGTSMAFDGTAVIGSIAGGCVEGAVVGVCEEVLADGVAQTVQYGVSDEDAFAVGLTCGGIIRVHVRLFDEEIERGLRAAIAGSDAEIDVCAEYTEQAKPPARMIILGAMEYSAALAKAATVAGYRVTVCDARPLFATAERFPTAEVVVEWPPVYLARTPIDERTVICVLSHDWRFDAEAIEIALASPAAYVGAMGSRTTHDRRIASLRERGVVDTSRLRSPIGLAIGASTPEETAISILAEVIAARTGATGAALAAASGPIHARA
jgi:xanthine dehydrogenase accessory factor